MAVLLDTSVLGRLANRADVAHPVAVRAIAELHRRGDTLYLTPQSLIEFRAFATRPTGVNGLGLPAATAEALGATFEASFPMLAETPDIFPAWKAVVGALGVIGKQVHDARLIAVCQVHAVTHVLTFNVTHFARLAGFGPGVAVVDPATV